MRPIIAFMTAASHDEASRIARALVEEGLAACCSVIPSVESVYRWKGGIEQASETLVMIKSSELKFDAMRDRIVDLHSYETPELIVAPITGGLPTYLAWMGESLGEE